MGQQQAAKELRGGNGNVAISHLMERSAAKLSSLAELVNTTLSITSGGELLQEGGAGILEDD